VTRFEVDTGDMHTPRARGNAGWPAPAEKLLRMVAALALAVAIPCVGFSQSESGALEAGNLSRQVRDEPPILGVTWVRGYQPRSTVQSSQTPAEEQVQPEILPKPSPNLNYHGGPILHTVETEIIFWGTSWPNYKGDKISGLDSFYAGFSNSNYAATSDEYTGVNGQIGPEIDYLGHIIDVSPASADGSPWSVLSKVCSAITRPDPDGNGYYAVYSDRRRGRARFCSYHSSGSCGGTRVQFAFFFKLDGDAACNPRDLSRLHSEGLAAVANVSGHELSEARTDPTTPGAWYDSEGEENADKCAWTFNVPLVTFSDGNRWKIQGNWSNAAYNAGTGYRNRLSQKGCLNGR